MGEIRRFFMYICVMMKSIISILCLLTCFQTTGDREILKDCLQKLRMQSDISPGNLMVRSALFFSDKPYVAHTLEINETESLVVNLREFDCTTLVETCLAMTLSASHGLQDSIYTQYLQKIRYRNGIIDGYTSRLHYSSDWIATNSSAGFIRDITKETGGKELPLHVNYMSTHPDAYKQLKNHPEEIEKIKKIEANINRQVHYYIPKKEISACEDKIQNGDILFFVTSIEGLDISHMGIAHRYNGKLTFIHASSLAKKVIINPESLEEYCLKNKSNKGIMVCRVLQNFS